MTHDTSTISRLPPRTLPIAQATALLQATLSAQLREQAQERQRQRERSPKPIDFEKPPYGTPGYWRTASLGWITMEEAETDHLLYEARRKRAKDSYGTRAPAPDRHSRPEPHHSRQYADAMNTTAARDDRLTPQAKALLQVIRARCGGNHETTTTKTTLAAMLSRCPRSIQRYIAELVQFGYIRTQTVKSPRSGLFVGLKIWITEKVLPYFAVKQAFRKWKAQRAAKNQGNPVETTMSPTNKERLSQTGGGDTFLPFVTVLQKTLLPT